LPEFHSVAMPRCTLCNDQVKKNEDDPRLAFDFTPEQLEKSAYFHHCHSCLVILEGLRQSQSRNWSFKRDIKRVYARCRGKRGSFEETLLLEIYFVDSRPKQELEYYSLGQNGMTGHLFVASPDADKYLKHGKLFYHGRRQAAIHYRPEL
jgi:hypothetical protein